MKNFSVLFVGNLTMCQKTKDMEDDQLESGQEIPRLAAQNVQKNTPNESGRFRKVFNL